VSGTAPPGVVPAEASATEPFPPTARGYYVLAVLVLAYIVSYIDRTMLTLLVDPIRATLQISDLQVSLLHGFAFAIFYTVLGLPMGRIADRHSRRNLIIAGICFWSCATALCGFARSFWQMFTARVGVGVGEATLSPAAYSLLSDYFPPERRSRALSIYTSGIYLGAGIATFGGGALIAFVPPLEIPGWGHYEPWQVIFMIIGLLGLPVALALLTVREPLRRGAALVLEPDIDAARIPLRVVLQYMWQRRQVYGLLILGIASYAMMTNGLKGWIPTFLKRTYGWSPADIGVSFGLVLLVFGTIGTASGGFGAAWLRKRDYTDANMRLSVFAALLVLPFGVAAPLMPTGQASLALYAVVILLAGVPFGVSAAVIQQITPNRMRGQVSAIYLFWLNLAGIGTGPIIVAFFTDYVFHSDQALRYSLACLAAVTVPVSLACFAAGLKPFREALRSAEY
jgi:MFS family permease